MAHNSKVAVSRLLAEAEDEGAGAASGSNKSRGDYKKMRELEEMRKAGTAPAAVDETGKDINPHIPQYISDAPWYLDPKGPTLSHQRPQEEKQAKYSGINEWYPKGQDAVQTSKVATKYRKGACENCGAMTHKKKDCLERPRKVGAKYSGNNFAPDEKLLPSLALGFDGKRDRWNGYDSFAHHEVVEEYKKLEEVKKEVKKERLKQGLGNPEEDDGAMSSDEDEDKYVEKMDMPGTKVDAAERYTVRNLRIREDTAKYLRNLDPNSAYYDPKTRAMRKNPYEGTGRKDDEVEYAGDNFVRVSGDTVEHAKSQLFAWEAGGKGLDVHALAEPTKLEALKREYVTKKSQLKDEAKSKIFDKYGGEAHLKAPPRELIFAQTEEYVEYSRTGKVIKGQEATVAKSRYEEDVYHGNHTSVFGSYWSAGQWGYKCCHSFIKKSYCTGDAGKAAFASTSSMSSSNALTAVASASDGGGCDGGKKPEEEGQSNQEEPKADKSSGGGESEKSLRRRSSDAEESIDDSSSSSEDERRRKKKKKKKDKKKKRKSCNKKDREDFEEQVQEAIRRQTQQEASASSDDRKRGYNSLYESKAPTEAEMEAYYRKRQREDDPMKHF